MTQQLPTLDLTQIKPEEFTAPNVSDADLDTIRSLLAVWRKKFPRNALRTAYADGKIDLKSTENIPREAMRKIEATLGWPDKAVTVLAERSVFEGFVTPAGDDDPLGLEALLRANNFNMELPQTISAAYRHSCSFITTALGDTAAGEPEVLILPHSAEWSAALWDHRRRCVKAFLAVNDVSFDPNTGEFHLMMVTAYLADKTITIERATRNSDWITDVRMNPQRRVHVEAMPYDPQLNRPFGRSRISRAVMNITDHALMTIVRTEIASDFYAVPRLYALGLAEDAFKDRSKWKTAIDAILSITRDPDGNVPEVGQFKQMTMQPLIEQYRLYATMFSGETGVPVSNLGIVTDNPPSAEALYADDRRLVSIALRQNRIFGERLVRVAQSALMLRDRLTEPTREMERLDVSWANPAFTSPSTSADALSKLATVFPWIGESEVALEFAGFTRPEITRLMADKRRAEGRNILAGLAGLLPNDAERAPAPQQMSDAPRTPEQVPEVP